MRDPERAPMITAILHPAREYDVAIACSPPHESATGRLWLAGADRYEPQWSGELGARIATAMERRASGACRRRARSP